MDTTQAKKPTPKGYTNDSLIEQLRDVGRGVVKTAGQDLFSGVANNALDSLFGTPKNQSAGQMQPGQEVNLNQTTTGEQPFERPEFPFRRRPQETFRSPFNQEELARLNQHEAEVSRKIEEIRLELKALIATIRSVDRQIQQAVAEETIDPGIYHLNFLDRLKTLLKVLRQNLADSSSWLAVMRSRKKEKFYWNQYRKKGTTFGLSHERVVATQVG